MKLLAPVWMLFACLSVSAQDYSGTTTSHKMDSDAFGKERTIDVYTPFAYDELASDSAIVIYIFDGQFDALFDMASATADYLYAVGEFPLFIAVGIHTENRPREFTPAPNDPETKDGWGEDSDVGNSALLDRQLQNEVMPFIQENYRVKPLNFAVGHSLGGTYVTNAIMTNTLFKGVLSISPNTKYDNEQLVWKMDSLLKENKAPKAFHYMTAGTTGNMENSFRSASDLLDSVYTARPSTDLKWHYVTYEGLGHSDTPMRSIGEALSAFGDLLVLDEPTAEAYLSNPEETYLDQIKQHYSDLSGWLGFNLMPSVDEMNNFGYIAMGEEKYREALGVFEYGITVFPEDSNIRDSRGEALESLGEFSQALTAYQEALDLINSRKDEMDEFNFNYYHELLVKNVERAKELVEKE